MNNHDRSPIAIPAHIQERIAARQRSSGGACYGVVPATSSEPNPVVAPLGGGSLTTSMITISVFL